MMVQKGTKNLAIIITPRIDGKVVTQTEIKTIYSNSYINDTDTPLDFSLEIKSIGESFTVNADKSKSTESKIYFPVPDTVYAETAHYTILAFWEIGVEKIYTLNSYHLTVEDSHDR